jgi:hypothetical protein
MGKEHQIDEPTRSDDTSPGAVYAYRRGLRSHARLSNNDLEMDPSRLFSGEAATGTEFRRLAAKRSGSMAGKPSSGIAGLMKSHTGAHQEIFHLVRSDP